MPSVASDDRVVVVSTDGHCGAQVLAYKPYLERSLHDEFDAWALTYHDAWDGLDGEFEDDIRLGLDSAATQLNWDSARRLEFTERQGIVAEVLFPNTAPPFSPSGVIGAPGPTSRREYELRFAGFQAHNRWLADFCADVPGRRAGIAQILLDDVDAAVAEVRRAKQDGLQGVLLPGDHTQRMVNLYYPHFEPLWQVCAELEMPIHRHGIFPTETVEGGGPASPWIGSYEQAFYTTRGLGHLICAGVFERHPSLRYVTTEPTESAAIPALIARLDATYDGIRAGTTGSNLPLSEAIEGLSKHPSEYFATNCFVAGPLDWFAGVEQGGMNLMFGADIPHAEGTAPFTREAMRLIASGQSDDELLGLLGRTAVQVYGFNEGALSQIAAHVGPTLGEIRTPLSDEERPRFPQTTRSRVFADRYQ